MSLAASILAASALVASPADHPGHRSLTDFDSLPLLTQAAPAGSFPSIPLPSVDDEAESTRENLILARRSIRNLTESLAIAKKEAAEARQEADELSLRLEALGVPGIAGDEEEVEQRLVAAIRDLRLLKDKYDAAQTQLIRLVESMQLMVSTAEGVDPEIRATIETEIRKTNELLGASPATAPGQSPATLSDAMVIDTKPDLALVVGNIGSEHGVQVGMPFQVLRNNLLIGRVRVVDVRESIAGAIIESLENESQSIKVGDRLRVDAKK